MTELQMALIGLGAFTVISILAYNKWQESRHRKIAERMIALQHADVLLDGADLGSPPATPPIDDAGSFDAPDLAAQEAPSVLPPAARGVGERVDPVLRVDPHIEGEAPAQEAAEEKAESAPASYIFTAISPPPPVSAPLFAQNLPKGKPANARPSDEKTGAIPAEDETKIGFPFHFLSPLIDYVASFEAIEAASAHQILESQRDFLVRVRKPVYWVGYNEHRCEWERIIDEGQNEYRCLCVGLQLVDRNGPAHEGDLSVFHLAMQDLADELMAVVDLPPRQYVLETAAQLDRFSAEIDIQIGLNILSQIQPFAGTKLRALAEAAGMTFDDAGHFVRRDDDGNVLYRLSNLAEPGFSSDTIRTMSTRGITFLLDVPRVAHGDRVFNQMLDIARRFADALHGLLVDDNRRPLSDGELEPIRRQVVEYQAAMALRNLPAGGHLALRLFS